MIIRTDAGTSCAVYGSPDPRGDAGWVMEGVGRSPFHHWPFGFSGCGCYQSGGGSCSRVARGKRAFTLVEMLVVVALVVLIMAIMAEVIQIASGSLSELRASQTLLQRSRLVETIIRDDLRSRTIRQVMPPVKRVARWLPGNDGAPGQAGVDDDNDGVTDFYDDGAGHRWVDRDELGAPGSDDIRIEFYLPVGVDPRDGLGYFMIEENSPADEQGEDGDDVLAFTVRYRHVNRGPAAGYTPAYLGRVVPGSEPDRAFPPADDGIAGSDTAEVIYFVRGGTLYRRVLLVGVPQPTVFNPNESWYAQYDISARPPLQPGGIPIVNTLGDLTYRSARYGMTAPRFYRGGLGSLLGLEADSPFDPLFPFGPFDPGVGQPNLSFLDNGVANGVHDTLDHTARIVDTPWDNRTSGAGNSYPAGVSPPAGEIWWGRPLLRETASPAWDYPTGFDGGPWSPNVRNALTQPGGLRRFDPTAPPNLTANLPRPRAGEDALLTGVVSFDVKVWDPAGGAYTRAEVYAGQMGPGAFVDIGYAAEDYLGRTTGQGPYGANGPPPGPLPGLGLLGGANWNDSMIGLRPWPLPGFPSPTFSPGPNRFWPPRRDLGAYPGFGNPWLGFPGLPPASDITANERQRPTYVETMLPPPRCLWRTFDTWCTAYTIPPRLAADHVPAAGVAPPYPLPIRAIQIKIRFVEERTGLTRELTIVEELR